MTGLIHIYCGDGKGKTTAALGIVLRAVSAKNKVLFVQFLKDGNSSELKTLSKFSNVKIITGKGVDGFTFTMTDKEKEIVKKIHNNHLTEAIDICKNNNIGVLVLDEIIGAINLKLVDYNILLDFLKNKPENLEVIMTGRDPNKELIDIADYVSEVKKIKHPYDKGIEARVGIDM